MKLDLERIKAIELLAACQAINLRRPLKSTPILEKILALVREHADFLEDDRVISSEITNIGQIIKTGEIWKATKEHSTAFAD